MNADMLGGAGQVTRLAQDVGSPLMLTPDGMSKYALSKLPLNGFGELDLMVRGW